MHPGPQAHRHHAFPRALKIWTTTIGTRDSALTNGRVIVVVGENSQAGTVRPASSAPPAEPPIGAKAIGYRSENISVNAVDIATTPILAHTFTADQPLYATGGRPGCGSYGPPVMDEATVRSERRLGGHGWAG